MALAQGEREFAHVVAVHNCNCAGPHHSAAVDLPELVRVELGEQVFEGGAQQVFTVGSQDPQVLVGRLEHQHLAHRHHVNLLPHAGLQHLQAGQGFFIAPDTPPARHEAPPEAVREVIREVVREVAVEVPVQVPVPGPGTLVVDKPLRSGQQVYARGGDLVVMAPVSAGAELLADGNIHVYGPLRGRALAGVKGDTRARIFCQQMGAEMLSVAGQYKTAEELRRDPLWGQSVQISLSGDVLNITRL